MLHISIAAEKVFAIAGFPVTNSLLTTWLVMVILLTLAYLGTRNITMVPSNGQSIWEMLIGGLYDFFKAVTGEHIKLVYPVLLSLFIFIITANWVGLLPGVGTIGFNRQPETASTVKSDDIETNSQQSETTNTSPSLHESTASTTPSETTTNERTTVSASAEGAGKSAPEATHEGPEFVPLLRGTTADINATLALALSAVLAIQYFGFKTAGKYYTMRFINLRDPINFFLGILEIISEMSKVISFAFRLFGNIFAGEVLLSVMAFLMPFIAPLPFLMLELFVGFIQALVFSMLTAVFLNVAISHGEHEAHLAHELQQRKNK